MASMEVREGEEGRSVEARKGEACRVGARHFVRLRFALNGALRHCARPKVPLSRVVIDRANARLHAREGLPDNAMRPMARSGVADGADAEVQAVRRPGDSVPHRVAPH